MRHGSLFSGIGGFDLAAEWMEWENIFHCEINKFGQQVLKYYWPNAISYEDITKTDFTIHRGSIDILTGGFPCQPYSLAGKRLGKEDERHLWPEMLRAITEIQPRWIVGENVFGIVNWNGGMVFNEVQTDLEIAGYEVQPFVLPACAVNAPHRRDRVWFVAYSTSCADRTHRTCIGTKKDRSENNNKQVSRRFKAKFNNGCGTFLQPFTDTNQKRLSITQTIGKMGGEQRFAKHYKQWKQWHTFPTQPPVCGRNDGVSYKLDGITFSKWRSESIKAYGNAIVPQVVYQIFKAIEQYELNHS